MTAARAATAAVAGCLQHALARSPAALQSADCIRSAASAGRNSSARGIGANDGAKRGSSRRGTARYTMSAKAERVHAPRNFPITTLASLTGAVRIKSILPARRSSARRRIVANTASPCSHGTAATAQSAATGEDPPFPSSMKNAAEDADANTATAPIVVNEPNNRPSVRRNMTHTGFTRGPFRPPPRRRPRISLRPSSRRTSSRSGPCPPARGRPRQRTRTTTTL